jgi:hypothetical protein
MSRLLTLTATGQTKAGSRQRTLTKSAVAVGPVSVQFVLVLVGTLVGLFYLVQSNQVSTDSLQLKELEAKKAAIVEENERLSIEAARLQSVQQIKKSADEQKLTKTDRAAFAAS